MKRHLALFFSLVMLLFISYLSSSTTPVSSSLYLAATFSPTPLATMVSEECIQSFNSFAYQGPLYSPHELILPLPPWQTEAILPPHHMDGYFNDFHNFNVALTRFANGNQEIWITGTLWGDSQKRKPIIYIYTTETQEWTIVSADIDNTSLFVEDLFLTSDGTVWGKTGWDTTDEHIALENVSVLSKFNETLHRFELIPATSGIPLLEPNYNRVHIVLNAQDVFWILIDNNGIFSYDPVSQTTEKHVDLPNLIVRYLTSSPDGTIYFSKYINQADSTKTLFTLTKGSLFRFIPATNEVESLDLPDEEWPIFAGMLVDYTGKLWLGSIGYRDMDDKWHLIHPNPNAYFDHAGDDLWSPAKLILETSDGILWYTRYLDTSGLAEGTAWYDPETGQGCQFTNYPSNIVEDSRQQLWMIAGGTLYRSPLFP